MNVDVEVTIPDGDAIVSERAEDNIQAAVRMIQAGAKPESVLRTLYLFGVFDGMLRA